MGSDFMNKNNLNKLKKIILLYGITFISAVYIYNYNNNKSTNSDNINEDAFDKYSKGQVYIGNKEFLDNLDNINETDILVEDQRNSNNPSMKIRNSYLITDSNTRNEILNILLNYEKQDPSDWDRTIETMDLEWEAHNVLYYLNYKKDHTTDVDLDNEDEKKYEKLLK